MIIAAKRAPIDFKPWIAHGLNVLLCLLTGFVPDLATAPLLDVHLVRQRFLIGQINPFYRIEVKEDLGASGRCLPESD